MSQSSDLPAPPRRFALLVGVDYAPEAQNRQARRKLHASADAREMAEALQTYGKFQLWQNNGLLLNDAAKSQDIKDAILSMEANSQRNDLLLFYFSGHGLLRKLKRDQIGPASDDQFDVYLATWDFSEEKVEQDHQSRLSMSWLRDKLYKSQKAGQVVIILDCCNAGYMSRVSDSWDELLWQRMSNLLLPPNEASGSLSGGARLALLATGHTGTTGERNGHGFMTSYLLPMLKGEVYEVIDEMNEGAVSLLRIYEYLQKLKSEGRNSQQEQFDLPGTHAGQRVILAWHEQRARELRRLRNNQQPPYSYIPSLSPQTFLPRPDEQEREAQLLPLLEREQEEGPHIVGLIGPDGVGKTRLAKLLAHHCRNSGRYPKGIFWMSAGNYESCLSELARLALRAEYLPQYDDPSRPENDERRASHFCRYLAQHSDILLVIDNLTDKNLIKAILPHFAGGDLNCTIVYTAIERRIAGRVFPVLPFSEETAMTVLLQEVRPDILHCYQERVWENEEAKQRHVWEIAEVDAARAVCHRVDYLPLAVVSLQKRLQDDPDLTLTRLLDLLNDQGTLRAIPSYEACLRLNWESLADERQRRLFLLAALFPAATPLPFWLLELVAGFAEPARGFHTFGVAYRRLEDLHWIMVDQEERQIRLPHIPRDFGLHLLHEDASLAEGLKAEAGRLLVREWCDLHRLQANIQASNFWQCLERVRLVRAYAQLLGEEYARAVERIERRMDRESVLLTREGWGPERLPALFYQQLYNRAVEENDPPLTDTPPQSPWLRLEQPVGAEDRALLRIFGGHRKGIRCVAISPDGRYILTGSNDHTAYLWEGASGKLHFSLSGHNGSVTCAAFSADGCYVVTGSDDETIHVWDREPLKLRHALHEHNGGITCIACSADGTRLVSGSNDRSVRLWDLKEGRPITRWLAPMRISALVLDERRQCVLFASGDTLWKWDLQQRKPHMLRRFPHTSISALALSPDGSTLAIGILDPPEVHLWDCDQSSIFRTIRGHTGYLHSLTFSPDGRSILTGASDETARVWALENGRCVAILMGHIGAVTGVAYAPGGSRLLTGSTNHAAWLWDEEAARKAQCALSLDSSRGNGARLHIAPHGRYALVLDGEHAEVWLTEDRTLRSSLDIRGIETLAFSADGDHLLIGRKDRLELYSCDKRALAAQAGEESGRQKLWRAFASEEIPLTPVSTEPIFVLTANQRYRISASYEGRLICEEIVSPQQRAAPQVEETEEGARVLHMSFSPDERLLLVSNTLGRVFFFAWDGHAIRSLLGLYQAFGRVAALRWLEHNRVLIADIAAGLAPHFHRLHLEGAWRGATRSLH